MSERPWSADHPPACGTGSVPADWIEHRRAADGELLGWIRREGESWVPVSVLGRAVSGPVDWLAAEEALERIGLGFLTGVWTLDTPTGSLDVRIVQVAPDGVVVQTDDFGAIDVPVERLTLSWPAPESFRPRR